MKKQAYVSPPTGSLEITVIRDAQPRIEIMLDLGIPFTVFNLKFPLVEDQPKATSGLVAEAVYALLDEVATFMMSTEYDEEQIVVLYATILATFKTMSTAADSKELTSDPTVKTFEGTFVLPIAFVNETQKRVVTAATKIERMPKVRHIELTYSPKPKPTVNDAARVIRQYRNRSLKQQPKPLYVIVYDQMGRPTGTLALGPKFKNQLLSLTTKKGSVDFSPPISFPNEQAMKSSLINGIPKAISVGGMTYRAEGVAGKDMALYHGPQDWLAKFPDGRSQIFPGRPTFRNMRRLNFPIPRNRFNWTILPPEEPQKPAEQSIGEEGVEDATSGRTL